MPPMTSRDFQKAAAAQRFTTAEFLLRHKHSLDAEYLAGYTIECSLTALILEKTPAIDRPAQLKMVRSGAQWHRPEILLVPLQLLILGYGLRPPGSREGPVP